MRLPTVTAPSRDSDVGNIDAEKSIELIRYAIDHGVDYVDTAYNYHGGHSETLVGKALEDGYRERVRIATKLPVWLVDSPAGCDEKLNEQLAKLQTDYVDFYLLHALNAGSWKNNVLKHEMFEFLDRAKADGRIKYAGFSFHDELPLFKEIVDAYDWDFCQIQLNYMDEHYQAGVEGLEYAAKKDLAVVIMEPLRGGRLVKNIPDEVQALWDGATVKRSPAEWAFRWVANYPQVNAILSGMGTMEELQENIRIMSNAKPQSLTSDELTLVANARDFYNERTKVKCTECQYCMPCPAGVAIPKVFSVYNNASIYNVMKQGKRQYSGLIKEKQDASLCVECGQCEELCPQNLAIIEDLKSAHVDLT